MTIKEYEIPEKRKVSEFFPWDIYKNQTMFVYENFKTKNLIPNSHLFVDENFFYILPLSI
ncbi:hypothetical protein BpHYR1_011419 [Brachionus plicatilis]|uniref:Uncharacterized protein n=1 Tax=Brachionus plicatilis TaxID=10195 RepID=A0A3M7SAX0_BRAPC|nr:hypothetical protein BpHYR1_011419 [Brachionus plicatilis]